MDERVMRSDELPGLMSNAADALAELDTAGSLEGETTEWTEWVEWVTWVEWVEWAAR